MNRAEQNIQIAIVGFLRAVLAPPAQFFHVPNGGLRTKREAALFKAMGVLAGVPDLIVLAPGRQCLLMEVKAPGGRLEPSQDAFAENARACGLTVALVRSIDDVRLTLRACGIATREAPQWQAS